MRRFLPFLSWVRETNAQTVRADLVGGVTVALVLIPQSMAYAQLAGLPAYYGLYAAFLPPVIASLFGSSRQLATGPVAIVSLLTAATLEPLATSGSEGYVAYAVLLSVIVGTIQLTMGLLRLGILVNFLSHPVVTGFANAGALIIASSQLSRLLGVTVEKADHQYETVARVVAAAWQRGHLPTLVYATVALGLMMGLRRISKKVPYVLVAVGLTTLVSWLTDYECIREVDTTRILSGEVHALIDEGTANALRIEHARERLRTLEQELEEARREHGPHSVEVARLEGEAAVAEIDKMEAGERCATVRSRLREFAFVRADPDDEPVFYVRGEAPPEAETDGRTWRLLVGAECRDASHLKMSCGGAVVGKIPDGLPPFALPRVDLGVALRLLPAAFVIALLGFMEAISIAKAMAARTGQRLDPNQELIGQGLGCLVGSATSSYPVSGSFSRSAVNLQAGAETGLSMVFASIVVAVTLIFLTPLLYHLPQSVLAAVIMMAVIGLVKPSSFVHAFRVSKRDGVVAVVTFVGTLLFAPHLDRGIAIGVALSLVFYLAGNVKPSVAVLSLHPDGSFRNARRWNLTECRYLAVVRFNESLIFANATYLEDKVLECVEKMPDLRHVLIVGNGINEIDSSGEEELSLLVTRLREAGLLVSLSGLNDRVVDLLARTGLMERIGRENLHRNVARALEAIHGSAHAGGDEKRCPLRHVVPAE